MGVKKMELETETETEMTGGDGGMGRKGGAAEASGKKTARTETENAERHLKQPCVGV